MVWPTFGGLAVKTLLFAAVILWARRSDVGTAALRGAVGADVFAWCVLTLLDAPLMRLRFTAGFLFEAALVAIYLNRETLFAISPDVASTAVTMLVFFLVVLLRAAVWAVSRAAP